MSPIKQPSMVTGRVVSNKMEKSVTVKIERKVKHPIYHKYVKRSTKLHVHDANNLCSMGDIVTVCETRPFSRTKSWTLVNIEESTTKV
jgi:small subunit ribosomal protein S17